MSIDDIDLDRVVTDPDYRRQVIEFLNGKAGRDGTQYAGEPNQVSVKTLNDTTV